MKFGKNIIRKKGYEVISAIMKPFSRVLGIGEIVSNAGIGIVNNNGQMQGLISDSGIKGILFAPNDKIEAVYPQDSMASYLGMDLSKDFPKTIEKKVLRNLFESIIIGPYSTDKNTFEMAAIATFAVYQIWKGVKHSSDLKLYKIQSELLKIQEHIIISLSNLVENRDSDTGEHVRRTSDYVYMIATSHHEKWNGKGYPYGLKENEIPLSARIMSLADVFDALTTPRCYKEPFSFEKSIEIIQQDSGIAFDPQLTNIFLANQDKLREIMNAYLKDK